MNYEWLDTSPFLYLMLPEVISHRWEGTHEQYNSAVSHSLEWIQIIHEHSIEGLVLGGDQSPILVTSLDNDPIIIRWIFSESDDDLIKFALALAGDTSKSDNDLNLVNNFPTWEIFHPAYSRLTIEADDIRRINIPVGTTRIITRFAQVGTNSAITHRFLQE